MENGRARDAEDAMDISEELPELRGRRLRVDDLHSSLLVDEEVAGEHAQW